MINSLNAANAYSAARSAVAPGQSSPAIEKISQAAEDFALQMSQVDAANAVQCAPAANRTSANSRAPKQPAVQREYSAGLGSLALPMP